MIEDDDAIYLISCASRQLQFYCSRLFFFFFLLLAGHLLFLHCSFLCIQQHSACDGNDGQCWNAHRERETRRTVWADGQPLLASCSFLPALCDEQCKNGRGLVGRRSAGFEWLTRAAAAHSELQLAGRSSASCVNEQPLPDSYMFTPSKTSNNRAALDHRTGGRAGRHCSAVSVSSAVRRPSTA